MHLTIFPPHQVLCAAVSRLYHRPMLWLSPGKAYVLLLCRWVKLGWWWWDGGRLYRPMPGNVPSSAALPVAPEDHNRLYLRHASVHVHLSGVCRGAAVSGPF